MTELKGEDITFSKFAKYENLRVSGLTNMFDVATVTRLSGLTRNEVQYIMKNYSTLKKKFVEDEVGLADQLRKEHKEKN